MGKSEGKGMKMRFQKAYEHAFELESFCNIMDFTELLAHVILPMFAFGTVNGFKHIET